MTSNWRRWTQPETINSKYVRSGGTEPMPQVYCELSFDQLHPTGPAPAEGRDKACTAAWEEEGRTRG